MQALSGWPLNNSEWIGAINIASDNVGLDLYGVARSKWLKCIYRLPMFLSISKHIKMIMGLLPDKLTYGLRMRRECQERFPCHRRLAILTWITDG